MTVFLALAQKVMETFKVPCLVLSGLAFLLGLAAIAGVELAVPLSWACLLVGVVPPLIAGVLIFLHDHSKGKHS